MSRFPPKKLYNIDSRSNLCRRFPGQSDSGYSKPGPLSSKQNKRAHQASEPEPEPEDDIRYEPITESFIFEDQIIDPCYVVLPFSTEEEIANACNPHRNVSLTP